MEMLPRIMRIVSIEPYKIVCIWNTGEKRAVNLEARLKAYSDNFQSPYYKLLDSDRFNNVKYDPVSQTIYWDNLITMVDTDGTTKSAPFDFCPDVLYEMSEVVG